MLINGIVWLIAAAFALCKGIAEGNAQQWLVIAVAFAAIGLRRILKHFKDQKKAKEE